MRYLVLCRICLIYLFGLCFHLFGCFLGRLFQFGRLCYVRMVAVRHRHRVDCMRGEHRAEHMIEPGHL